MISNKDLYEQIIKAIKLQDDEGEDYDPTPWCHVCGAITKSGCNCIERAKND